MYLKVTDAHLATACMVPTVKKVVPDMAVIEGHERSEDISKWAMRDSTIQAFKAVSRGLLDSAETKAVSNPTLSETVAQLIYG